MPLFLNDRIIVLRGKRFVISRIDGSLEPKNEDKSLIRTPEYSPLLVDRVDMAKQILESVDIRLVSESKKEQEIMG